MIQQIIQNIKYKTKFFLRGPNSHFLLLIENNLRVIVGLKNMIRDKIGQFFLNFHDLLASYCSGFSH